MSASQKLQTLIASFVREHFRGDGIHRTFALVLLDLRPVIDLLEQHDYSPAPVDSRSIEQAKAAAEKTFELFSRSPVGRPTSVTLVPLEHTISAPEGLSPEARNAATKTRLKGMVRVPGSTCLLCESLITMSEGEIIDAPEVAFDAELTNAGIGQEISLIQDKGLASLMDGRTRVGVAQVTLILMGKIVAARVQADSDAAQHAANALRFHLRHPFIGIGRERNLIVAVKAITP